MVSSLSLESLVGKPLKDLYGRHIGVIVGVSTDISGNSAHVGVDTGFSGFVKVDGSQLFIEDGTPILVSEWKNIQAVLNSRNMSHKRLEAIDELYCEGEVNQDTYEKIASAHKMAFEDSSQKCQDLTSIMNNRINTLNSENRHIEEFICNLKIQYKTKEIDDSTYCLTNEHLQNVVNRNNIEMSEILTVLGDQTPKSQSSNETAILNDEVEKLTVNEVTNQSPATVSETFTNEVTEVATAVPTVETEDVASQVSNCDTAEIQDSLSFDGEASPEAPGDSSPILAVATEELEENVSPKTQ